LPPKHALRSRQCVENMLKDGFSSSTTNDASNISGSSASIEQSIPSLPLVTDGSNGTIAATAVKTFEEKSKQVASTNKKKKQTSATAKE